MDHTQPRLTIVREAPRGHRALLAFLGGAAAGALVALLTAPRSGAELRARLRDLARDQRDKMSRLPDAVAAAEKAFHAALKGAH